MKQIDLQIALVVFRIDTNDLCIFMPQKKLPSAYISASASLDKKVEEIFQKNLGFPIGENYVEQLFTFSKNKNEIMIVYYLLLSACDKEKAPQQAWWKVPDKKTADTQIISYAIQRLQWKIEYTNVIYSLLPQTFTLSELQKTYEIILGKKLDKRNFRKKIFSLNFLKPTGEKRVINARPAQTYTFIKREPQLVRVFS